MEQKKAIIALLVENNVGVLYRVAMLFDRRGYNIENLTASETNEPGITRLTITATGDESIIRQLILQTRKLVEVRAVELLDPNRTIQRELLLVKVLVDDEKRSRVREICQIFGASIVDVTRTSLIIELTGNPDKIDAFLDVLGTYDIIEQCRTGVTSIGKGPTVMDYEKTESHRA